MEVSREQLLAFRVAAHGVAERTAEPLGVLGAWTVQDSPPGAAATALHARARELPAGWLEQALEARTAVALWNPRTALAVLPAADVPAYLAALRPADAELRDVLGRAVPPEEDPAEAVALAVAAVSEALDDGPRSRDALHEELRVRLPAPLLPWCEPCGSHHARRGLLVAAGLHGRLCVSGREGRQPVFSRTDRWLGGLADEVPGAARALVRRYLRAYGPSTPRAFAGWAGVGHAQARRLWQTVEDELRQTSAGWVLGEDADLLADPPPARGVRLLPPGDPLLLARDPEVLLPDPAWRRRQRVAVGQPGVLLVDGTAAGLWRPRKQGRRLGIAVAAMAPLGPSVREALDAEAAALAPHRGAASATVTID